MTSGAFKRKRAGMANIPVLVSLDQREMIRAAAAVHGVTVARWLRETLTREAVLTLLAAQNRPVRLRPGAVIWAVAADLSVVARQVAMGTEKGYLVGPADVPAAVDPTGAGFVIDLIGIGEGYIVGRDAFRWVGRPFRKAVVEPCAITPPATMPAGEVSNVEVDDDVRGGGPSDPSGMPDGAEGRGGS